MATPQSVPSSTAEAARQFSPVEDEPPLRWQRAVHLAPCDGLGTARRAVFFALLTWLPIALWAVVYGRFLNAVAGEPLLQHYGVHVRCLVAIPLFILAESTLHRAGLRYLPQFITTRIVDDVSRPRFEAAVRTFRRWRDSSVPWFVVIGGAFAWTFISRAANHADEMSWAFDEKGALGFGGAWFAYVVRPIFVGLLLGWLWRIALISMFFLRFNRLGLSLVPSHPDRAGGLGFLEKLPAAFGPVSFGLSATLAAHWAHMIVYHGLTLDSLKVPIAIFVVFWAALLLVPLAALMPVLYATKRAALPSYAAMVAEQARLVRQRWIDGTTKTSAPLLEPEGIGVVADAATMYGQVRAMRIFPIGTSSLVVTFLPIAVPLLAMIAIKVPLAKLLFGVVKALI